MAFLETISAEHSRSSAKLSSAMRKLIRSGKALAGDPLPSERAMTEHLGVSRSLVRATFAELEKEGLVRRDPNRVRRVADQGSFAGGIPVVALIGSRNHLESTADLQKGWDEHVSYSAGRALQQTGNSPLFVNVDSLRLNEALCGLPPNTVGAILAPDATEYRDMGELVTALQATGLPLVAAGSSPDLGVFDRVVSDHAAGAVLLTDWLFHRGRRRILRMWRFSGNPRWLLERSAGYEKAANEAGIPCLPVLRTADLPDRSDAENFEIVTRMLAGYLTEWLRSHPEGFDAVMVATDRHAFEVAAACRILGIEPVRDVDIVGYDDSWAQAPEREFEPSLPAATINKDNFEIGCRLTSLLTRRLNGELPADERVVERINPTLVIPGA